MPLDSNSSLPTSLETDDFILRAQAEEHNEDDYRAVMLSKAHLREWSDSPWPEDSFSLKDNLKDLKGHIDEAEAGSAYGFSVFSPDEDEILGSVYVEPVAPMLPAYVHTAKQKKLLEEFGARIEYWLRPELEADAAWHSRFLEQLKRWLDEEWSLDAVFGSRRGMKARRKFYESHGLKEVAVLKAKNGSREFHFHAQPRE